MAFVCPVWKVRVLRDRARPKVEPLLLAVLGRDSIRFGVHLWLYLYRILAGSVGKLIDYDCIQSVQSIYSVIKVGILFKVLGLYLYDAVNCVLR